MLVAVTMMLTDSPNRIAVQAEENLSKTIAGKEPTFAEIAHCLAEWAQFQPFLDKASPHDLTATQIPCGLPQRYIRRFWCRRCPKCREHFMGGPCKDKCAFSQTFVASKYQSATLHLSGNTTKSWCALQFRDDVGKKKPVEKRKLEKHYLDFIKLSQKFYRGYIQHLSSHYVGIPALEQVAKKFSFESNSNFWFCWLTLSQP